MVFCKIDSNILKNYFFKQYLGVPDVCPESELNCPTLNLICAALEKKKIMEKSGFSAR